MVIDGAAQPDADRRAVERVSRGDVGALGELYDRYARGTYSLALHMASDTAEAEEVVQDMFTQGGAQCVVRFRTGQRCPTDA